MSTRTQGILDRVSDAPKFSGVRWILGDGVLTNYMQSYVDDTMKMNAEFQSKAGVQPKIVRKSPTKCCPWCDALVGTYNYPDDVPDDVYRRHDNCNCIVEFYPGDGKKQDVWDKKWSEADPLAIEKRKKFTLQPFKKTGIKSTPQNIIRVNNKDISITEETYTFGANNGTYPSKTLKADVYTTQDGVKFYFEKGIDTSKQHITPREIIAAYDNMPKEVRERAQKVIEVVDYYNPADSYWRKKYRRFNHSYATGGDKIIFWRNAGAVDYDYLVSTLNHEAGHHIDKRILPKGGNYSDSVGWTKAIKDDKVLTGKKSPTKYGENSPSEDFAESVAEYEKNKKAFAAEYPNRAELLKRIFRNTKLDLFT